MSPREVVQEDRILGVDRTALSLAKAEPVEWLWPRHIPRGKLTLIDGDPGLGKSTLTLDLAARVTTGRPMPDGASSEPGTVALLTAEDGIADTVLPRFLAAGGNAERVQVIHGLRDFLSDESFPLEFPSHLPNLLDSLDELRPSLIIVDPLAAFLGPEINTWRDHDVRRALTPLGEFANALGTSVVAVRHLTKGMGGSALYRGGGSIGIIGAARAAFLVARDPQDRERRLLAPVKMNLGPMPAARIFRIESAGDSSRIVWEGESTLSADGLLSAAAETDDDKSALEEARAYLSERLGAGPMPAKQVTSEARSLGISDRTLQRAKRVLGIVGDRQGFGGSVTWTLPETILANP
jgi:AAA domain